MEGFFFGGAGGGSSQQRGFYSKPREGEAGASLRPPGGTCASYPSKPGRIRDWLGCVFFNFEETTMFLSSLYCTRSLSGHNSGQRSIPSGGTEKNKKNVQSAPLRVRATCVQSAKYYSQKVFLSHALFVVRRSSSSFVFVFVFDDAKKICSPCICLGP